MPDSMIRIRLSEWLPSAQLLPSPGGRKTRGGIADITVRQNIQLHWVRVEDLPEILQVLFDNGLTTMSTCGDVPRT